MMPGWSFTRKRRYQGVSKSQVTFGEASCRGRCGRDPSEGPPAEEFAAEELPPAGLCATNIRSETTATAVGSPPAPAPRKAISPPYFPEVKTRFRFFCTRPKGDDVGTRLGPTSANNVVSFKSAREICRMVQPSSAA